MNFNTIILYFLLLLSGLLGLACEDGDTLLLKRIPVNTILPNHKSSVLVAGFLSPETDIALHVYHAGSITQKNPDNTAITTAQASILNITTNAKTPIRYNQDLKYYTTANAYTLAGGQTYEVTITLPNRTITGRTTIPTLVPVDAIRIHNISNEHFADVTWADPIGEDNYYHLILGIEIIPDRDEEDLPTFEEGGTIVGLNSINAWYTQDALYTDEGVDGTRITVNVELYGGILDRKAYKRFRNDEVFIVTRLYSVDRAYYQYLNTIYDDNDRGPGSNELLVPEEVTNGLGVISSYRLGERTFNGEVIDID